MDSIDNLNKSEKLPKPSVVKIDVEGAEHEVLKGMSSLLSNKSCPTSIFLEVHPKFLPSFGTNEKEIVDFLIHKDYKIKSRIKREDQVLYSFSKKNI